ncbi:HNH endonuclease [Glycomyces sp. NPDC021274]|uniref:HNH endonuclease n=1 Tax=Glycomyces sp. NPDC021274 TaxID=3155120 RepID=UPI0033DAE6C4
MNTNERKARQLVRERSGGICEVCGLRRATNFQHRKNRSQGGRWTASNGLDVCGTGTTECHGDIHSNPTKAYEAGWSVKSWDDETTAPVRTWRGLVLLDDEGGWKAATR